VRTILPPKKGTMQCPRDKGGDEDNKDKDDNDNGKNNNQPSPSSPPSPINTPHALSADDGSGGMMTATRMTARTTTMMMTMIRAITK
jgi:hypothetical protein